MDAEYRSTTYDIPVSLWLVELLAIPCIVICSLNYTVSTRSTHNLNLCARKSWHAWIGWMYGNGVWIFRPYSPRDTWLNSGWNYRYFYIYDIRYWCVSLSESKVKINLKCLYHLIETTVNDPVKGHVFNIRMFCKSIIYMENIKVLEITRPSMSLIFTICNKLRSYKCAKTMFNFFPYEWMVICDYKWTPYYINLCLHLFTLLYLYHAKI